MGLLQLAVTWYMLEGKLPTGTSKTKKIQIYLDEVALFWMSQWAACPPACTMWPLAAKGPLSHFCNEALKFERYTKLAGPQIFFIDLVRPQVELNHDSGICLWGIWPLEICGHKIAIFCYAILPS